MSMIKPVAVEKKPIKVAAIHVTDIASSCAAEEWMIANGYQTLYGDATKPETLRYKDQVANDNTRPESGWYIDPVTGNIAIRTLEGDMLVGLGSWVIMGVAGEFYPCADDIFKKTYSICYDQKEESE